MSKAALQAAHGLYMSRLAEMKAALDALPDDDDPLNLTTYLNPPIPDATNYAPSGKPYLSYLAPFNAGSLVHGVDYKDELYVTPAKYPSRSRLKGFWPTSAYGVKGYLQLVTRGNYDSGVPKVATTPLQVGNISNFTIDIDWTFLQSLNANYLDEFYLTTTKNNANTKFAEIGFFLYAPPNTKSYLASTSIDGHATANHGEYTDLDGVKWLCRALWNPDKPGVPFITFLPKTGNPYFVGRINYKHVLNFLLGKSGVTASHWVNGYASGIEIIGGTYDVLLNSYVDVFN